MKRRSKRIPFPRRLEQAKGRPFRREQAALWFSYERGSGLRF